MDQEFVAPGQRFFFEVIAQRPVAQHLKKGQVRRVAHLVDIVGADALLEIGQAFAQGVRLAQQEGHQRVHPGGGEQHGGIIFRQQRRGGDALVAAVFKKAQIGLPVIVSVHLYSFNLSFHVLGHLNQNDLSGC